MISWEYESIHAPVAPDCPQFWHEEYMTSMRNHKEHSETQGKAPSELPHSCSGFSSIMSGKRNCFGPLCLVLISAITLGIYSALPFQEFTNWDDPKHIAAVWKPSLERAWRIVSDVKLTYTQVAYYIPLHFLSLMADQALVMPSHQPQAWISKTVNIIFHALNACLLFSLLTAAGLSRPAALFSACIFAVHPMQVGTVAWVAERKNLLASFFYLIALRVFVVYLTTRRAVWFVPLIGSFLGGLLSKPSAVTLPLALGVWALLIHRPHHDSQRATFIALGCLITISFFWGLFVLSTEISYPGILPPWYMRPLLASGVLCFYLSKFVWPVDLVPVYPRWDVGSLSFIFGGLCFILVLCVGFLIRFRRCVEPLCLWGLAFFFLNVLPVAGIIPFGFMGHSFVSDHLAYLPLAGLATALGATLQQIFGGIALPTLRRFLFLSFGIVLALLAVLTMKQTHIWDDSATLWEATLKVNQKSAAVFHNYGNVLMERRDYEAALTMFRRAAELSPSLDVTYSRMGRIYRILGDRQQARAMFERALEVNPRALSPWLMLATMFREEGNLTEAVEILHRAVTMLPEAGVLYNELGICLRAAGRNEEALRAFQKAIRADPLVSDPYWRAAEIVLAEGDTANAMLLLKRSLQLHETPYARNMLGVALIRQGDVHAALKEFQRAYQLQPNLTGLIDNIAHALLDAGESSKARVFCLDCARQGRACSPATWKRLEEEALR